MSLIKVIILGAVQGLTEFLPVSSSGHLVLFRSLLGLEKNIVLNVFLHFGTLLAVCIVYWDDVLDIITFKPKYRKFTIYLILGSVPAGVIGILFEDFITSLFTPTAVGFMLLITGLLLWLSDKFDGTDRKMEEMNLMDALVVGSAQAFAIIPGISRSGSTIVGGLFRGLERKLAAKYSFLLSVPVIAGATLLKTLDLVKVGVGEESITYLVVGTLTAMIVGYLAIKLLLKLINQEKLSIFAYYCWILGVITIILNRG
ncbi:undecaprenyl-diphosphatase UppP [Halobacteroides halobius DSM 5150]|uniref:Undecaprenyl-diphosphatase n=1 Tax=Halobacteroides halobius (strain ATCC 35273 / DSM 5150 / MD-1) TaxID=748449 RepID=L0K604_HALHC|nr:undecaprenyl-diphosphatase UppP [Halobacteroides halobius]AGB40707.1 undecaprenyl-diphosphatase UppP [Halobacteroides halobius DSM 5150]